MLSGDAPSKQSYKYHFKTGSWKIHSQVYYINNDSYKKQVNKICQSKRTTDPSNLENWPSKYLSA